MFINYVVGHLKQFRYIKIRKRHSEKVLRHERKNLSLLQSDYNQITIGLQSATSSSTSWKHTVQAVPSKKRKKTKEKERMKRRRKKEKRWKIGEGEKGMERVCAEGNRKGRKRRGRKDEDEEEGEGKEEEKEKQKMEKAVHERHRPLQKIFPSTKLGNNMTPIKGRLGKNTTPTSNNPVKLN